MDIGIVQKRIRYMTRWIIFWALLMVSNVLAVSFYVVWLKMMDQGFPEASQHSQLSFCGVTLPYSPMNRTEEIAEHADLNSAPGCMRSSKSAPGPTLRFFCPKLPPTPSCA